MCFVGLWMGLRQVMDESFQDMNQRRGSPGCCQVVISWENIKKKVNERRVDAGICRCPHEKWFGDF